MGRTLDWRIDREVLFHPDDLPESGLAVLRRYIEERTHRRGAPPRKEGEAEPDFVWRNERRVVAELRPISQFLKLFYLVAYKESALVIGFDLPRSLTRLATFWHEVKKGRNLGAWHLDLWTFRDMVTGMQRPSAGFRPGLIVKRKAPDVVFIEFTGRRADPEDTEGRPRHRGEFLDLSNLAHALTGRHRTLVEAVEKFTGEVLEKDVEHGRITPDCIDHRRNNVRATISLAETLLGLFDSLHPVSRGGGGRLAETRLYSPGGLARAHLAAAGFSPPAVQEDRLGSSAAAFFGSWAEVWVRGRVPVVYVDYRREYQMVFLLQGLQDLLAAERLAFVDDTETVQAFIESVTLDDLFRPEIWPKLNVLCWVKPAGEILIGRWAFDQRGESGPDRFSLAMAPRYSDEPVVVYLAGVIAAKVLCGRAPALIRAERIVPIGRKRLRKTRLFGGAVFDPRKDQLFKILVEEGERLNRGEGHYADIPEPVRAAILPGVKAIGNIAAFGDLIETREGDLLPNRREEVTLLSDAEPLRAAVAHPEDPGPCACPPIAGLVTAGGRLLLAMVHRLVTDRGGIVAACDTDGAHIVATPEGGKIYIEMRGANFHEGGAAQPVRALSWAEVEEIAARFEALNPFDRTLLPGSPLRVHRVNFDQRQPTDPA
jgi:hypothetical protein